jgi:hypothetical protein
MTNSRLATPRLRRGYLAVGGTSAGRRRTAGLLLALGALLITGCGSSSSSTSAHTAPTTSTAPTGSAAPSAQANGPIGPEGVPLEQGAELAPASTTSPSRAVDGVHCAPVEQLVYHIHAHLQVYVGGQPRSLPAAIGLIDPVGEQTPNGPFYGALKGGCYYWLHTHTYDGVIHIESPTRRIYTLGDFFDEWRQPLSTSQVASAKGTVTAFVNGQRWAHSPRAIPLVPHAVIQLDVGSPTVPFSTISWAGTGL